MFEPFTNFSLHIQFYFNQLIQADINESVILDFARSIRGNGFSSSQIEIDDNWESCYGEATFNTVKIFRISLKFLSKIIANVNSAMKKKKYIWIHATFTRFFKENFLKKY
jgi:hypothetical protein